MNVSEPDWSMDPVAAVDGADATEFVLHIPFEAADLRAATALADLVLRSLSGISQVAKGSATVTRQGNLSRHFDVWCDHLLLGGVRCDLRAGHDDAHQAIASTLA